MRAYPTPFAPKWLKSSWEADTVKVPRAFVERLTDAVCYAA